MEGKSFGEMLRQARVLKGLTQEEVAERIGVSRVSVSHWERGVSAPDDIHAVDLALIFGKELLDWPMESEAREQSSRMRATSSRLREADVSYVPIRMPQSIYDLVAQRISMLRVAGLPERAIVFGERLLSGAVTGQSSLELGKLTEPEWFVLVNGAWAMLTAAYHLDESELYTRLLASQSTEQAAAEAEVLRRLPALPEPAKKKGKRGA